jgi:hypothetical protein
MPSAGADRDGAADTVSARPSILGLKLAGAVV